jgi:hypothetical protein
VVGRMHHTIAEACRIVDDTGSCTVYVRAHSTTMHGRTPLTLNPDVLHLPKNEVTNKECKIRMRIV